MICRPRRRTRGTALHHRARRAKVIAGAELRFTENGRAGLGAGYQRNPPSCQLLLPVQSAAHANALSCTRTTPPAGNWVHRIRLRPNEMSRPQLSANALCVFHSRPPRQALATRPTWSKQALHLASPIWIKDACPGGSPTQESRPCKIAGRHILSAWGSRARKRQPPRRPAAILA